MSESIAAVVVTYENDALIKKYVSEAERLNGKVYFLGRLGEYKYYNMDQAVARALMISERILKGN
jgi:UDP-galactopyranose mutase